MYSLKDKVVLLTGSKGFLGSHILTALRERGCETIITADHDEYDLTKPDQVMALLLSHPQVIIQMAGLVGGIGANMAKPADFYYTNLMIDTLMMKYGQISGVERFAAAAAGCGYPEDAPKPLNEKDFWRGYPQEESAAYSLAKRMLPVHSKAQWIQNGFQSVVIIPGNIFGVNDNFRLEDSHVIPALVRKFVDAVEDGNAEVVIWGSGKPTRDFVYAGDVAEGIVRAIEVYDTPQLVNISSGVESSISEVVTMLKEITGFKGAIVFDPTRPDGQLRRRFDIGKAQRELDFKPQYSLGEGLRLTVEWYRKNRDSEDIRK